MLHMNLLIFCLLPNSNLQLALFVPSLLGPLCNSWLCILCIFFRNFSQLQDIHSWLNSDFHFSNGYLFTSLFWIETHIQQESVPQEFPQRKIHTTSSEHWKSGWFPKTNSRNASPNPALLPVPETKASSTFFVAVTSTFCWDGCDFSMCARSCR